MKAALQILGFSRVHHAYELYDHPEQCEHWIAAWEAKRRGDSAVTTAAFWNPILADYDAVADMPSVCFAAELMQAYPTAKVVFTQREEGAWFRSFDRGVLTTFWQNCGATAVMSCFDWTYMAPVHKLWTRLFARSDGFFASTSAQQMRDNAIPTYRRHNETVLQSAAEANLLRYDFRGGWGPLCEFLHVPVPAEALPWVNEGDAVKEVVAKWMQASLLRIARNLALGVAAIAVCVVWMRR